MSENAACDWIAPASLFTTPSSQLTDEHFSNHWDTYSPTTGINLHIQPHEFFAVEINLHNPDRVTQEAISAVRELRRVAWKVNPFVSDFPDYNFNRQNDTVQSKCKELNLQTREAYLEVTNTPALTLAAIQKLTNLSFLPPLGYTFDGPTQKSITGTDEVRYILLKAHPETPTLKCITETLGDPNVMAESCFHYTDRFNRTRPLVDPNNRYLGAARISFAASEEMEHIIICTSAKNYRTDTFLPAHDLKIINYRAAGEGEEPTGVVPFGPPPATPKPIPPSKIYMSDPSYDFFPLWN